MKAKNLRLAFIYAHPAENRNVYTGYHHGLGSLSAVLREKFSHTHRLFHLSRYTMRETAQSLADFRPDVVLVTSCSGQMKAVAELMAEIRRFFETPCVVIGGPHATALPEQTLGIQGVRAVCLGEGENAICEFIGAFSKKGLSTEISGMWFREDSGNIRRNALSPQSHPDDLPFADRELFDFQKLIKAMPPEVGPEFLGSRGCCFDCSYCGSRAIHGDSVRFRSPESLIKEITAVKKRYSGFRLIGFHDNIFTLNKGWMGEFCERYEKEIHMPYWCNTRVGCFAEEDIRRLKKSGCRRIHMGIESGSPRIRKDILHRDLDESLVVESFRMVRKHGIRTVAFNMLGLPTETEEDIQETIRVNRLVSPSWIILSVFNPFPGTALYERCRESRLVRDDWADDFYGDGFVLDQESISAERVKFYFKNFIPMVYGKSMIK